MSTFIAEQGPESVRIWTADDRPALVAAVPLEGHSVEDALGAFGWRRVGPWAASVDTPAGYRLAAVVPATFGGQDDGGGVS